MDEMLLPGDVMEAVAMDIMKAGQFVNVSHPDLASPTQLFMHVLSSALSDT